MIPVAFSLLLLVPTVASLLGENGAGTWKIENQKITEEEKEHLLSKQNHSWNGIVPQVQPMLFPAANVQISPPYNGGNGTIPQLPQVSPPFPSEAGSALPLIQVMPAVLNDSAPFIPVHHNKEGGQKKNKTKHDNHHNNHHNKNNNKMETFDVKLDQTQGKTRPEVIPLINQLNDPTDGAVRPQVMPLLISNYSEGIIRPQVMPLLINESEASVKPLVMPILSESSNSEGRPLIMPLIHTFDEKNVTAINPSQLTKPADILSLLSNISSDCQKSFSKLMSHSKNYTFADMKSELKKWAAACGKEEVTAQIDKKTDEIRSEFRKNVTALMTALPGAMEALRNIEEDENMTMQEKQKAVKTYLTSIKDKNVVKTVKFLQNLFLGQTINSMFSPSSPSSKDKAASPQTTINAFREFLTQKRLQKLPKDTKENAKRRNAD